MKDYLTKRDPNLDALIARYKEPEPTVEPEPVSELKPEPMPMKETNRLAEIMRQSGVSPDGHGAWKNGRRQYPEQTSKPEPMPESEHQASVTFVDAGGKPIEKPEPEYIYVWDGNPDNPAYPELKTPETIRRLEEAKQANREDVRNVWLTIIFLFGLSYLSAYTAGVL